MQKARMIRVWLSALMCLSLTACGFHLRETTALPIQQQTVLLQGISTDRALGKVLQDAFTDARSTLITRGSANTVLKISGLEEGRRVASYASDLSVRQYLLYLLFDYEVVVDGKTLAKHRMKLDNTLNYDADFVLGKQEEERQIRMALRQNAARLILLKLRSL